MTKVKEYIDSVDGYAHNSAVRIIHELELSLKQYEAGNVPTSHIIADNEAMAIQLGELEEQLKSYRWIPVEERPNKGGYYEVIKDTIKKLPCSRLYDSYNQRWQTSNVIFWRPIILPEAK